MKIAKNTNSLGILCTLIIKEQINKQTGFVAYLFNIRFVVKLSADEMAKSLKVGLLERFNLISSVSLTNMVAFDPMGKIKKYESPLEIMRDFYYVRLEYYQRRKDHITDEMQHQLTKLSEQARFINRLTVIIVIGTDLFCHRSIE